MAARAACESTAPQLNTLGNEATMKHSHRVLAGAAIALAAVSGAALPALALPDPSNEVTLPSLGSAPDWGVSNEELVALLGTQTQAEIDAIAHSGEPAVLLVDDDGSIRAAALADEPPLVPARRAVERDWFQGRD
ncbi:hypothetical protein [Leucobacter sp. PH1c]|uniref:hypothetical protein n=1 Tax=Leucobacter sp. PH1c TaxID=1397278 RepID=UPI0012FF2309|nr:hypothetical protein [Leucobacter sp. PH1c]